MQKQKNKSSIKRFLVIFLMMIFLAVSVWVLFLSNYTEISEVEIETETINKEGIEEFFQSLKNEKYFNLISKNNFFLFPRNKFADLIKNKFELVREVNFKNKFPNQIEIEIEERTAVVIWCSAEKCFLMDERGVIFREILEIEREEQFKNYLIISDKNFDLNKLGESVDDNEMAIFLTKVRKQLDEKLEIKIQREAYAPSLISKEIRVKTEEGWEVYFNLEQELENQILLLEEVLNSEIKTEERKNLNYIDLRIEGKAIYNGTISN